MRLVTKAGRDPVALGLALRFDKAAKSDRGFLPVYVAADAGSAGLTQALLATGSAEVSLVNPSTRGKRGLGAPGKKSGGGFQMSR